MGARARSLLEDENLYVQVEEVLRSLRRIEHELHADSQRISALERDFDVLMRKSELRA